MRAQFRILKLGQNGLGIAKIILGQISRIGPRIRQDLVTFVKRLDDLERAARAEREAGVGLALERGEIVQERRNLGGRLLFLFDRAGSSRALCRDRLRSLLFPNPFGPRILAAILLEVLVEPTAAIASACEVTANLRPARTSKSPKTSK